MNRIVRSRDAQNRGHSQIKGQVNNRLDEYFHDVDIREVMVNAGSQVWVERNGELDHVGTIHPDDTRAFIERTLLPLGRRIDITSPIVDARLSDGSRLCAVIPPIAVD